METYTGMTSTQFKDRFRNHTKSFNHEKFKTETTLSQYVWKLKSQDTDFDLAWKIVGRAKPFSPVTGVCALCTLEKFIILTQPSHATLNKKEEIYNSCRHKTSLLLDKTWFHSGYEGTIMQPIIILVYFSHYYGLMIEGNMLLWNTV